MSDTASQAVLDVVAANNPSVGVGTQAVFEVLISTTPLPVPVRSPAQCFVMC